MPFNTPGTTPLWVRSALVPTANIGSTRSRREQIVDIREHDLGIRKRVCARYADTPGSGTEIENTIGKASQPRATGAMTGRSESAE